MMGTKLSQYCTRDSGFPSLKKFFKHLRKIVGEEGMVVLFLEHAKSLLTIYHIGFASSLHNAVLLALRWWVEVSEIHLSYPLPTHCWSPYSSCSWCEVSFAWLSYVTSPNVKLCRAEKNTAVSIR